LPVDPGTHVVEAAAPGRKPWTERVNLAEQGGVRVVQVPPLAPAPVHSVAPARRSSDTESTGGVPTGTIIAGAVSAVSLGGTAYFGLRAKSAWNTRDEHCPGGVCDEKAVNAADEAALFARLANGSAAVGVVAAGFAIYFALIPKSTKTAAPPRVRTSVPFDVRLGKDRIDFSMGGTL
jgi:hypothetical protein